MAQSADPVFEALGLCANQVPEPTQEQVQLPEHPFQSQPDYMNPMHMQQQMQMQYQSQIQQQVMYQVQQHVQQHIQQQMQQSASEPGAAAQETAFKNPEAICAFAAAATAAALVYFQATGVAPPAQQLLLPEVLPATPAASAASPYCSWGMPSTCPTAWQTPAWYNSGATAVPAPESQAAPVAGTTEEVAPCTPVKSQVDYGAEGIITPSPVPLDAAPGLFASPPMVLKLSEVMTGMEERSPTTTASERRSDHSRAEPAEENAGAMLLQLLKSGSAPEEEPIEEEPWQEEAWQEEPWDDWEASAWEAEPKQRRRRRRRGPAVGTEGHQTPSTVASDNERQALAASGQELLRQLRGGAAAKEVDSRQTYVRRAKNGDVRIFDRI